MTTKDLLWFVFGESALLLTLWWAYTDQSVGVHGRFEFPRATRPIRYWLVVAVFTVTAIGVPISVARKWMGY